MTMRCHVNHLDHRHDHHHPQVHFDMEVLFAVSQMNPAEKGEVVRVMAEKGREEEEEERHVRLGGEQLVARTPGGGEPSLQLILSIKMQQSEL